MLQVADFCKSPELANPGLRKTDSFRYKYRIFRKKAEKPSLFIWQQFYTEYSVLIDHQDVFHLATPDRPVYHPEFGAIFR